MGITTHYYLHIGVGTVLSDLGQVAVRSGSLTSLSSGDTSPLQGLVGNRSQLWSTDPEVEHWPTLSQGGAAF